MKEIGRGYQKRMESQNRKRLEVGDDQKMNGRSNLRNRPNSNLSEVLQIQKKLYVEEMKTQTDL